MSKLPLLYRYSAFTRKCVQATTIGDLEIPEGMDIQVNMEAIHMDRDIWGPEDTQLYVPERWEIKFVYKALQNKWVIIGENG